MRRARWAWAVFVGCGLLDPGFLGCTSPADVPEEASYTVVTRQLGFAQRERERAMGRSRSPGLDIDGIASERGDPEGCFQADFVSPDGRLGIDNNFTFLFEAVEGLFEAGTVEALVQEAIREGRLLLMFRLEGVEDLWEDDDVQVRVFNGVGAPAAQGGFIVSDQTFGIREGTSGTLAPGRIEGGVLTAGPFDVTLPVAILNVFFDLEVRGASLRASVDEGGAWSMVIGGGVPSEVISEVGAMADAMQGDQIGPLLETFLPMWTDLARDASGACQAVSTNLLLRTTRAFLYPDARFE